MSCEQTPLPCFYIQLNSMRILIFVCSKNIAICLKQISKRQAGIFNSIRDSKQAAEKKLFKNQQSCFRLRENERLQGIWIATTGKKNRFLSLNGIVGEIPLKNYKKAEVSLFYTQVNMHHPCSMQKRKVSNNTVFVWKALNIRKTTLTFFFFKWKALWSYRNNY